jgi:hypothetical protein
METIILTNIALKTTSIRSEVRPLPWSRNTLECFIAGRVFMYKESARIKKKRRNTPTVVANTLNFLMSLHSPLTAS